MKIARDTETIATEKTMAKMINRLYITEELEGRLIFTVKVTCEDRTTFREIKHAIEHAVDRYEIHNEEVENGEL